MGCNSSKDDTVANNKNRQSRPASLPDRSSSSQPKPSNAASNNPQPKQENVTVSPPKQAPNPPQPPPQPQQPKEVVTKFQPSRGLTIITERETGKEKLYILVMHHSSVETFICMEPKMLEVSASTQPVTCYVFVISSTLFRQLCDDKEVKSQLCGQMISHINQLYNARGNYKVYRTELAPQ